MALIKDSHGRFIKKLRVSLLDACNMKCVYCMPEDSSFLKKQSWLSPDEIYFIVNQLTKAGLEEVRLTGGEPTLRPDFMNIVELLSRLPLKKFGITSNGLLLKPFLKDLVYMGCHHINISLDSLNPKTFHEITKKDNLTTVLDTIKEAKALGAQVKINTVLLKGINDCEILDFVEFAKSSDIEVRFLELMKIGVSYWKHPERFMTAGEALSTITERYRLNDVERPFDSTSFNFMTDHGANIGFIASETKPFCGGCSRLRLSADGFLRACLMSSSGHQLKGKTADEVERTLKKVIDMKPLNRISHTTDDMYQIGG